jgi:hypothetical protein
VRKEQKRWSEARESKSLEKEIENDKSARKKDCGQLNKRKNPPLDALENRTKKKGKTGW